MLKVSKVQNLIFSFLSFYLSQIIKEATHILENSRFCIDLISTSQPNMVTDSGVHASWHSNCHQQIIYTKFDLKIFHPPPYERKVWHFKHANSNHIKTVIDIGHYQTVHPHPLTPTPPKKYPPPPPPPPNFFWGRKRWICKKYIDLLLFLGVEVFFI